MSRIDTARGPMGVIDHDPGTSATPIVFLHGVGSDKSVWQPQIDHFGVSRRAIAIDYPGYGDSSARESGHDGFAHAVLAVMDAAGIARAHICGLSLGGVVGIALASLAPDRCTSLIIADSFAIHPDGQAIHDRGRAASIDLGMRGLAEARIDHLLGRDTAPALRAALVDTMAAIPVDAYHVGLAAVWLADQRARAAALTMPTLILVGSEDRITPPALSEELAALTGATMVEIAGAGHLANIEKPAAFNQAIASFLSEVEGIRAL